MCLHIEYEVNIMKKVCFIIVLVFSYLFSNFITMFFYLNPINIKGEVYSLVDEIENSAYKNYGRFDTKFNGIISREDFSEMNYRDNVNNIVNEKNSGKVSKVFKHNGVAIAEYRYIYRSYDNRNNVVNDSNGNHIIELHNDNGKWIVYSVTVCDTIVDGYDYYSIFS